MSVAGYLNWRRSLMTEGERNSALRIIPVRYEISRSTKEWQYTRDLDIKEHAVKWRDAIEFVNAGKYHTNSHDYWMAIREEYFRSGGKLKEYDEPEVKFE